MNVPMLFRNVINNIGAPSVGKKMLVWHNHQGVPVTSKIGDFICGQTLTLTCGSISTSSSDSSASGCPLHGSWPSWPAAGWRRSREERRLPTSRSGHRSGHVSSWAVYISQTIWYIYNIKSLYIRSHFFTISFKIHWSRIKTLKSLANINIYDQSIYTWRCK